MKGSASIRKASIALLALAAIFGLVSMQPDPYVPSVPTERLVAMDGTVSYLNNEPAAFRIASRLGTSLRPGRDRFALWTFGRRATLEIANVPGTTQEVRRILERSLPLAEEGTYPRPVLEAMWSHLTRESNSLQVEIDLLWDGSVDDKSPEELRLLGDLLRTMALSGRIVKVTVWGIHEGQFDLVQRLFSPFGERFRALREQEEFTP